MPNKWIPEDDFILYQMMEETKLKGRAFINAFNEQASTPRSAGGLASRIHFLEEKENVEPRPGLVESLTPYMDRSPKNLLGCEAIRNRFGSEVEACVVKRYKHSRTANNGRKMWHISKVKRAVQRVQGLKNGLKKLDTKKTTGTKKRTKQEALPFDAPTQPQAVVKVDTGNNALVRKEDIPKELSLGANEVNLGARVIQELVNAGKRIDGPTLYNALRFAKGE